MLLFYGIVQPLKSLVYKPPDVKNRMRKRVLSSTQSLQRWNELRNRLASLALELTVTGDQLWFASLCCDSAALWFGTECVYSRIE